MLNWQQVLGFRPAQDVMAEYRRTCGADESLEDWIARQAASLWVDATRWDAADLAAELRNAVR